MLSPHYTELYPHIKYSIQGLGSVPAPLAHLKQELGLTDPVWTAYGDKWRSIGALWLRAEITLSKTGRLDLSIEEINSLNMPEVIKNWILSTRSSQDGQPPDSTFGKIWSDYILALPFAEWKNDNMILQEPWCRPGRTGIIVFLLGLHWQAEYSGGGRDWERNINRVGEIFELILAHPELCVLCFMSR